MEKKERMVDLFMYETHKITQQMKIARYMLLGTVIATVVNLALLFAQSDMYIPYSSAIAYYFGWFGYLFDGGVVDRFTTIGMGLAAVVLAMYLFSWYMSANKPMWLVAGLVLVAVDTLILLTLIFLTQSPLMNFFFELAIHGAVIYEIAVGISAHKRMAMLPPPETEPEAEPAETESGE